MKTKQLTFILPLTFLFLFCGYVYSEELEVVREYYDSGKLKSETHYKNGIQEGLKLLGIKTEERNTPKDIIM